MTLALSTNAEAHNLEENSSTKLFKESTCAVETIAPKTAMIVAIYNI